MSEQSIPPQKTHAPDRSRDPEAAHSEVGADTFKRRHFLQGLILTSAGVVIPSIARARAFKVEPVSLDEKGAIIDSPIAALHTMIEGNRRFASGHMTSCRMPLTPRLRETAEKQQPFAAVLSCSDSRVPVDMVFDQELGNLFVARVAGNIATPEVIASLEYGVAVLGTKLIMVMGHGDCGAVKAAMTTEPVPGQISSLYAFIEPAVRRSHDNFETAIHVNAKIQAQLLAASSPVLGKAIRQKKLLIVPAYYSVTSGRVSVLRM